MKKILIIAAVLAVAGCSQPAKQKQPAVGNSKQVAQKCKYICIMDKDVCADKPGICPKCGMKLAEKEEE